MWSRRAFGLKSAVLLAALIFMGAMPVAGHDHAPPETLLVAGRRAQPGELGTHCWVRRESPYFIQYCADHIWHFPTAIRVRAGEARVQISKRQPPRDVELVYWRRMGDYAPEGRARDLPFTLQPRLSAGEEILAWDLVFRIPRRPGHLYMYLAGWWFDEEGFVGEQDADWTFHVRVPG